MRVPHDALIVVADGRKALFLRNEGDAEHLNLQVEAKEIHQSSRDIDQKSDSAGRASSTQSGPGTPGQGTQFVPSRSSMEETDYHQLEEDRFAAEIAETLKTRALKNGFETLIIAAPPRALGELRKHYHKEVKARLVGEISKDFTGHPMPRIEAALADA